MKFTLLSSISSKDSIDVGVFYDNQYAGERQYTEKAYYILNNLSPTVYAIKTVFTKTWGNSFMISCIIIIDNFKYDVLLK